MNRTRLLMIGVLALALGTVAGLIAYRNLQSRSGPGESGVPVVVAADDIQVGARIEEHDVRITNLPPSSLPANTYDRRSKVLGRGVVVPIAKGEFILPSKLAGEESGAGLPSLIPNGMRAVSVRVNEIVSVAGFVTPGTRVDVLLTGTPEGGNDQQTTTVLQNVRVIAAGHTLEHSATGEAQNTAVITLLVSPDDAQRLTLASSQGHIQLALRSPLDTKQDDVASSSARGLYKGAPAPAVVASVKPPRAVVRKPAAPVSPASSVVSVEVIEGDKKPVVVPFPEQGSDTKGPDTK
jgi:pilus assembly protein CpaB